VLTSAKPDFILVGGPKCGTATVSDWLAQHPDIFVMQPREPNFFGSDLQMRRHFRTSDDYRRQFEQHADKICGEGTTWYLYSERAAEEIFRSNPQTKILMVLRNPVELVHSLHQYRLYYGDESERDLTKVLDREKVALRRWSENGEPKDVLQVYVDVARYSPGVERYLKRFGADQVKILFFEDLQSRPEQLVREVFEFLGVSEFQPELRRSNEARSHRFALLGKLLLRPGERFGFVTRRLPSAWRHRIGAALRRANTRKAANAELLPELAQRIAVEVREDIMRLEALIGRNLTGWYGPSNASQRRSADSENSTIQAV